METKEKVTYHVIIQKTISKTVLEASSVQGESPKIKSTSEIRDVFSQNIEGELDIVTIICAVNNLKKNEPEKKA